MRINEPVTQRGVPVPHGANILSTTDAKGRITHVNDEFLRISGFNRDELIRQPHNIVRHPDMPRLAFEEFWNRLRAGDSWLGLVKNRCKNGDHYWVKAYATPVEGNDGQVAEYQSIRTALPDDGCIRRAEVAYAKLKAKEPPKGPIGLSNSRRPRLPLHWRLTLLYAACALVPVAGLGGIDRHPALGATMWVLAVLAAGVGTFVATAPLRRAVREARARVDDPLMEYVFTGSNSEFASLAMERLSLASELDAVSKRLADAMVELDRSMTATNETVGKVTLNIQNQSSETDQVAAAMEEMSVTVQEVARHAAEADEAANRVRAATNRGKQVIDQSNAAIEALSGRLTSSRSQADRLVEKAASIEAVLEAIRGITERTNLLALNASIEAARAGAAGRGFAVVADEVRELAHKTKASTGEIRSTIEELQDAVEEVVTQIGDADQEAETTRKLSGQSQEALGEIQAAAEHISGVNTQIATATEEQTNTSAQISENLSSISTLANQVLRDAKNVEAETGDLSVEVKRIHGLINRFASSNG